jgi:hypothetical protein
MICIDHIMYEMGDRGGGEKIDWLFFTRWGPSIH